MIKHLIFLKIKKKKDEGTFDINMNYFPTGFEDAIRTNEIGVTQGQSCQVILKVCVSKELVYLQMI